MHQPRVNIWGTVVAEAATRTQVSGGTVTISAVILTETRTGNVGTGTRIAGMIGTVTTTVVTIGTGVIAAARLRAAGTPLNIGGAEATQGAPLVAAVPLVLATTKLPPQALCLPPTASLAGRVAEDVCHALGQTTECRSRVYVGHRMLRTRGGYPTRRFNFFNFLNAKSPFVNMRRMVLK